ncbi:MAG: RNA 2',3'-cyclic phosphodiesterase [Nitrososphaeria archaeon]
MRCFVSVNLEELTVINKVTYFQRDLADNETGIKLVSPVNLHYTLRFLGDINNENINQVIHRLEKITYNRFSIELRGVGVFPDKRMIRVIWIGSASKELSELARMVNTALSGIGKDEVNFLPHLTVARVNYLKDRERLLRYISSNEGTVFGNFAVTAFYLMESDLMPDGPKYTKLRKFSLTQDGQ